MEMYKITCTECGKESEVGFKPGGRAPVYCRNCYLRRRGTKGVRHWADGQRRVGDNTSFSVKL